MPGTLGQHREPPSLWPREAPAGAPQMSFLHSLCCLVAQATSLPITITVRDALGGAGREEGWGWGEVAVKKSSSNPQQAKFLHPTAESWLGLGEQVWGSLGLHLPLRQWGTCWEYPPGVLVPSSPASPLPYVKSSCLQGPSTRFFPPLLPPCLSFPSWGGAAPKVSLGQSPEI